MISSGRWGDWISREKAKASRTASRWKRGGEIAPGHNKPGAPRGTWPGAPRESLHRDFAVLAELAVALVTEVDEFVGRETDEIVEMFLQRRFQRGGGLVGRVVGATERLGNDFIDHTQFQ